MYAVHICTSGIQYLQAIRVKFVYEGHRVKVKVTGAENVQNAYSRNVNFDRPQLRFIKDYRRTRSLRSRLAPLDSADDEYHVI